MDELPLFLAGRVAAAPSRGARSRNVLWFDNVRNSACVCGDCGGGRAVVIGWGIEIGLWTWRGTGDSVAGG